MMRIFHTIVEELRGLNTSKVQLRKFGLMIGIILILIYAGFPFVFERPAHTATLVISAAFIVSALFLPRFLLPLYYVWMGAAIALGSIISPIFLAVLFFGFLTPIGFVKRLFSPAKKRDLPSYWIPRTGSQDPKRMEELF